jgi:uroporphyrinogen III methyltransferase/synthase
MTPRIHPVALVGAGPGHPGLLTLRGAELLSQAGLVVYDRLVSPALLTHAPQARHVCVDEVADSHRDRGPLVCRLLIEEAQRGVRVVRLKGGDPMVFGRGGEEAQALREADVPFEVVPGVTAGTAALAYAGIPLTHRQHASAAAFVTAHECPGKDGSGLDWQALARFPGALVFFMGAGRVEAVVASLLAHGMSPDLPAAVIERGTMPSQRTVTSPLAELPAKAEGVSAPALIVVGQAVSLRSELAWVEQRPLFGKKVLIPRPRLQALEMARLVEELGGDPVILPLIDIAPPEDWSPLDDAIGKLGATGWVVFTSVHGVNGFLQRLRALGRDLRALGGVQLAAIGPATAEALRRAHLEPDLVPDVYNSEALTEALRERVRGQRVLLARADQGLNLLRDELGKVAEVVQAVVYRQVQLSASDPRLENGEVDLVALTSSNIALGLARSLGGQGKRHVQSGRTKLVAISPRTAAAAEEAGLPVSAVASEYTAEGVVSAMARLVR